MQSPSMNETTVKSAGRFHRGTLRITWLLQSDTGRFCVRSKILDRHTLKTYRIDHYFLPETMEIIVGLYIAEFCPDKTIRL
jgi:hypothetical protein